MQKSISLHFGGTSTSVENVVTLHGNEVTGSVEVDAPVVVTVAGGGPCAGAVDEAVGDCNALGGLGSEDDVLAGDAGCCDVVDPDHVGVVDGDCVAAPDVFWVDVGDSDVPVGLG